MHLILVLIFLALSAGKNEDNVLPVFEPDDCNCIVQSDTIYVTQNGDSGNGSLRCAIECASLTNGREIIAFNLPDGQDSVISLLSSLPVLSSNTWIINDGGQIFIDGGELNNNGYYGFRIEGDSIIIKGLHIRNFPNNAIDNYLGHDYIVIQNNQIYNNGRLTPSGDGLDLRSAEFCFIENNRIFSNQKDGISLQSCANISISGNEISHNGSNGINIFNGNIIDVGGNCTDCGNIIVGNNEHGIKATFNSSKINILKNYIGIVPTQVQPIPNKQNGIFLSNCDTVQIGKPESGNYISGNLMSGIKLIDSTHFITIQNNSIGYSIIEELGMPNGQNGIEILNAYNVTIGGDSINYANQIGFQTNHVFLGDSAQHCNIVNNEFFCSINGIEIENGSNENVTANNNFYILNSNTISGTSEEEEHLQLYLRNPLCNPCQGNVLLGAFETESGEWTFEFDFSLNEGDEISLLKTDMNKNTSRFSECKSFSCDDYDVSILTLGQDHICQNNTLTLRADNGTSFLWSTGETSQDIVITEGGTYSVMVWNEFNCPSSDTIYVPTYASPELTVTPSDSTVFCDDSMLLSAFGQGSFSWSTGETGPLIIVDSSGYYCVSLTNQYGCITETCIPVTKGEQVNAEIELMGDSIFCEGDSSVLIAKGGSEFLWNMNGHNKDELTVFDAGEYIVRVSNEYGCADTSSVQIATLPATDAYILPAGYIILCPGDSILLNAYGGDQYVWNNGSNADSLMVYGWGDYSVTATNEYGCQSIASKSISVKPEIDAKIINESPLILCEPDSIWLSVDYNKMDSIVWNTGDRADSLLVKNAGLYIANIFNLGCYTIDSVEVEFLPRPANIDSISGPSWSNPDTIQSFELIDPDPELEYLWEVDGGLILSTTFQTAEIQWTRDDFGLICVSAIDSNGCVSESFCRMIDLAPLHMEKVQSGDYILYPNPTSGLLNFEKPLEINYSQDYILEFYTPSGVLITRKTFELSQETIINKLDVSDLPSGIYWIKILVDNNFLGFEKILLNR